MSGPEGEEGPPLVDVDGLPQRYELPHLQAQRRWQWVHVVLGAGYLALSLVRSEGSGWPVTVVTVVTVVAVAWVVLGASGLVTASREHVSVEPEGVRRVGVVGRGRLTPWSEVAEVRPPDTWRAVAHLRGHGRLGDTTDLGSMSPEQARELQRRLEDARARAAGGRADRAAPPDGSRAAPDDQR